jgi:N-6 DNA Methylase
MLMDESGQRDSARNAIRNLAARLEEIERSGSARSFNEAQTVNEFVLPLFAVLGWDIHNKNSKNEVLPEQAAATGRADWTFSIRGVPRMLLEAKRLHADLDNPEFARQAINYAYSRGVTWAVLTNFKQLKVYNAEWALADPDLSRFLTFSATTLDRDFDRLWLLSRQSMEQGLLDAEAETYGKKRTKTPVGEQLFGDLIRFRYEMRKTFLAYNPDIPGPDVDHAVQRLLDRLIFIRAAEDREIEPARLRSLLRTLEQTQRRGQFWDHLRAVFREFDRDYDSQLFQHQLIDGLETESQPVWDTVAGLYGTPDGLTQFDFRGIDADVLGGVYEQYLGHISRVDYSPKRARTKTADSSRAIRKAHGVYYTPRWMVRYIVHGALEPLLNRYTEDEVRRIRILDPACGSGSFLVEAFRVLVEYWESRTQITSADQQLELRMRILRENLFGIDVDSQAIEIAQLNLLLAALNQKLLLPDLTTNFAVGNALFDLSTRKVPATFELGGWMTPVDVGSQFPSASGGFDAVVMNPPYYDLQAHPYQQAALRQAYPEISSGRDDVLYYFLARSIDVTRDGGQIGCVVARYWLDSLYADRLRSYLASATRVREILDFRSYQPFGKDVGVNAAILLAQAGGISDEPVKYLAPMVEGVGPLPPRLLESVASLAPGPPEFGEASVRLGPEPWRPTFRKASGQTRPLGELAYMTQGIKTGRNDVYVVSQRDVARLGLEPAALRPVLEGEDIGAYALVDTGRSLIYLDGSVDVNEFPRVKEYLESHRDTLASRAEVSRHSYPWWRLQRPRRGPGTDAPIRLLGPHLSTSPRFSVIGSGSNLSGAVGLTDTLLLSVVTDDVSPYFVLAVLNSRYGNQWTLRNSKVKRGGYREFFATSLAKLPVPMVTSDVQDLIVEFARLLQVETTPAPIRSRTGRFDDELNAAPPRSTWLAEIDRVLEAVLK